MGRHSRYTLYTGIGSGLSLSSFPNGKRPFRRVIQQLRVGQSGKLFSLVIVAEGHPLGGAQAIADAAKHEL